VKMSGMFDQSAGKLTPPGYLDHTPECSGGHFTLFFITSILFLYRSIEILYFLHQLRVSVYQRKKKYTDRSREVHLI
jgi:hypothetical protein